MYLSCTGSLVKSLEKYCISKKSHVYTTQVILLPTIYVGSRYKNWLVVFDCVTFHKMIIFHPLFKIPSNLRPYFLHIFVPCWSCIDGPDHACLACVPFVSFYIRTRFCPFMNRIDKNLNTIAEFFSFDYNFCKSLTRHL